MNQLSSVFTTDSEYQMKARVLLIEDDPAVMHLLKATIEYGGFDSAVASSAFEALSRLRDEQFEFVLLDLGLPDAEGGHLINEIRKTSNVPILVVSGDITERSKILALDAGADDFVEKPFLPGELLARIRAALRRGPDRGVSARSEPPFVAASNGHSSVSSLSFKHGSKEQKLLDRLQQDSESLVTSDEIITAVWGGDEGRSEKNVRVLVAMLRSKLKAQNSTLEIVNEHGRGYRLRDRAVH